MKSTINVLFTIVALLTSGAAFNSFNSANIYDAIAKENKRYDSVHYDTTIGYKIDSLDNEIKKVNETTINSLKLDQEVLRLKREELLHTSVCLDSMVVCNVDKNTHLDICDTIK